MRQNKSKKKDESETAEAEALQRWFFHLRDSSQKAGCSSQNIFFFAKQQHKQTSRQVPVKEKKQIPGLVMARVETR
jgi:hypothetical protein